MMPTTTLGDVLVRQLSRKEEEEEENLWFIATSSLHGDINTPPMANFKLLKVYHPAHEIPEYLSVGPLGQLVLAHNCKMLNICNY